MLLLSQILNTNIYFNHVCRTKHAKSLFVLSLSLCAHSVVVESFIRFFYKLS